MNYGFDLKIEMLISAGNRLDHICGEPRLMFIYNLKHFTGKVEFS